MKDATQEMVKMADALAVITQFADNLEKWADDTKENPPELVDLAKAYFTLKNGYEAIDAQRKRIYHVVDMLNKHLIPTQLEKAGLDMIRVPEIERSFSPRLQISASLIDKERGMEWLRKEGKGDLIQETVNSSTLASFVRNMIIDEGIDPPEDIVKVSQYYTTGVAKYNPNKKAKK